MTERNPDPDLTFGLTVADREKLRARLVVLRERLLARLARDELPVREEPEQVVEALDVAEQTREQSDAVLFSTHDRSLLDDIEHALAKFATGKYGLSEQSGDPIGLRRLQAVPWARVTMEEEEEQERNEGILEEARRGREI